MRVRHPLVDIQTKDIEYFGIRDFRPLKTGDIPVYLDLSFEYLDLFRIIFGGEHFQELRFSSFLLSYLEFS